MDFTQALTYLNQLTNYEALPSHDALRTRRVERMQTVLQALDNPHQQFQSVHVAGSKGKGSVSAMLFAILSRCGVAVGLYTSPHLMSIRERVQVHTDTEHGWISAAEFAQGMTRVRAAIEGTEVDSGPVTYFEAMTALACDIFARRKVRWAVMEVGVGGRLDATNVVEAPIAVMTPMSLEHTDILGDTVEEIAEEKAGIIKPKQLVISAAQGDGVLAVLREHCTGAGATLAVYGTDFHMEHESMDRTRQCCDISGRVGDYTDLTIPLLGRHQAENAALAVTAAEAVGGLDTMMPITMTAVREGLAHVACPGRAELIPTEPPILLDGAHNAASGTVLRQTLEALFPSARIGIVLGMSEGKDVSGLVQALAPVTAALWTTAAAHPRAMTAEALAAAVRPQMADVIAMPHVGEAIHAATQAQCDVVVLTGSLFLVGEVRRLVAAITR